VESKVGVLYRRTGKVSRVSRPIIEDSESAPTKTESTPISSSCSAERFVTPEEKTSTPNFAEEGKEKALIDLTISPGVLDLTISP
jgi:hypothetical protein